MMLRRAGLLLACAALCCVCAAARAEVAQDLTAQVRLDAGERLGELEKLADRDYATAWTARQAATSWVSVTSDAPVAGLYIAWAEPARPWRLEAMRDGAWTAIAHGGASGYVHEYLPVPGDERVLRIVPEAGGAPFGMTELFVLGEGEVPGWVQRWEPTVEKADLMILCAHPDDEFLYMGGTIPTYAGERKLRVLMVTMTWANRTRRSELLNALWIGGLRNYPVMGDFKDQMFNTQDAAYRAWKYGTTRAFIVGLFRRHQPEVVLTHDVRGEYGHGAHRLCANVARYSVDAAMDYGKYIESSELYGTWQVKKLYVHLGEEHALVMDWHVPLAAFDGRTALEVAIEAYGAHISQHNSSNFQVMENYKHSCAEFSLLYTTVGWDEAKNDFFEHIPLP